MGPNNQTGGRQLAAQNNVYTIILALAFCTVLAAAVFVACKCYFQYDTIFKVP